MKSLKKTDRTIKIITALIAIFVAITPQLITYIPAELSILSVLIVAVSQYLDQYITEKRVVRAEELKTKEYAEYPETHLKEQYDLITDGDDLLSELIDKIPYQKRIWITGFLKTTISSGLIATGIVSIFAGIIEHPLLEHWNEIGIVIGVSAIIIAVFIIILIDRYDEKKKKEELKIIDETIEEKAKEVAKELVEKELDQIKKTCNLE